MNDEHNSTDAGKVAALLRWMHEVSEADWHWVVKRLRGNDTLLTGSHQGGPYLSRAIVFDLFPSIAAAAGEIGTRVIPATIDSHGGARDINVKWYPSKGEGRLTSWGGSQSPLLDPEATGSVVIFAFHQSYDADADECKGWLCCSIDEEEAVENRVGPIEPGVLTLSDAGGVHSVDASQSADLPCRLTDGEMPAEWRYDFPRAADIVAMTVLRLPSALTLSPDVRLLRRRKCEYEVFRSIEEIVSLPRILEGFATVDIFADFANRFTNRRRSRAGASLGLQTSMVFDEEALPHSYDAVSEGNKRPDFLFPSAQAYHEASNDAGLTMLAAKTTCKDRWRQILNEADKIPVKHLLTLQEGVSIKQHQEMEEAGVVLVVPADLHDYYPEPIKPKLLSLTAFIGQTRAKCT